MVNISTCFLSFIISTFSWAEFTKDDFNVCFYPEKNYKGTPQCAVAGETEDISTFPFSKVNSISVGKAATAYIWDNSNKNKTLRRLESSVTDSTSFPLSTFEVRAAWYGSYLDRYTPQDRHIHDMLIRTFPIRDIQIDKWVKQTPGTDTLKEYKGKPFTQSIRILVNTANTSIGEGSFFIRPTKLYPSKNSEGEAAVTLNQDQSKGLFPGLAGTINSNKVTFHYTGTSRNNSHYTNGHESYSEDSSTFPGYTQKYWRWSFPLSEPFDPLDTNVLVSILITPASYLTDGKPGIHVMINKARFDEKGLLAVGDSLLESPLSLQADDYSMSLWQTLPLTVSSFHFNDANIVQEAANLNIEAGKLTPHPYYSDYDIEFLDQRTYPVNRRFKRCWEDFIQGVNTLSAWWIERLFGAPSICEIDTGEHSPQITQQNNNSSVVITYTTNNESPEPNPNETDTVVPISSNELDVASNQTSYQAAMDIAYCANEVDTGTTQADQQNHCNDNEEQVISWLGDVSLDHQITMQTGLRQFLDDQARGAAVFPDNIATGNAQLDQWVREHAEQAESLIARSVQVLVNSDTRSSPNIAPNELRQRKKKVTKTSCYSRDTSVKQESGEWQCVKNTKKRHKNTDKVVALPPRVEEGYVTNDSNNSSDQQRHRNLVREFLNQNNHNNLPPGLNSNQFSDFTPYIGRDAAPTGQNLGILYLNNPRIPGSHQRFSYGLSHIWTNNDGGHRRDWENYEIQNTTQLSHLIMTALTQRQPKKHEKQTNGNYRREYSEVSVPRGDGSFDVYSNFIIILGSNGMVITAYPTKRTKHYRVGPM